MSSHEPPIDPAAGGNPGEQPSPEEVRAYLEQVRGAPVDQVIAEVASVLLNAAQVKLGRRDARLLLDLVGDVTERVRNQVPDELTRQLGDVLAQLRLAQVEAEREVSQAAAKGHTESGDLTAEGETPDTADEDPAGSASSESAPPGDQGPSQGQDPGGSAASRLWIPGR